MGQFSWLDCTDGNTQILDGVIRDVYVLVPQEFQGIYGASIKEECYDGYGHFGQYDIYDLVADWNKAYIDPDTFSSEALHTPVPEEYGGLFPFEIEELRENGCSESEIARLNLEAQTKYCEAAKARFEHGRQRLKDFCSGMPDSEMMVKYGANYKREIGIDIACYDEDNANLRYPIKITHKVDAKYEFCAPSFSDPNQGWSNDVDDGISF